jgi:hypothetical protein
MHGEIIPLLHELEMWKELKFEEVLACTQLRFPVQYQKAEEWPWHKLLLK